MSLLSVIMCDYTEFILACSSKYILACTGPRCLVNCLLTYGDYIFSSFLLGIYLLFFSRENVRVARTPAKQLLMRASSGRPYYLEVQHKLWAHYNVLAQRSISLLHNRMQSQHVTRPHP